MSATATATKRIEVLRAEVREPGVTLNDREVIDRRNRAHFLPGRWRVKSCHRNDRFKHWRLVLVPLD
jgi:hypothetical protein